MGVNLALAGHLNEAEQSLKRAMQINEQALGRDHPDTEYCRTWLNKIQAQRLSALGQ